MKRRLLGLRNLLHETIEFRGRGLVESRCLFRAEYSDGLQDPQCPQAVNVPRVLRLLERNLNVALCPQIVDFAWLDLLHNAQQTARIGQVSVVQDKFSVSEMRILIEMVDAVRIEKRTASFDAMNFVAFVE